jgi:hypothetical protein
MKHTRAQPLPDDVLKLQRLAFRYFLDHTNAKNGLVADNTRADSPCSIAATGLGLSCHPVAVNNGWLKRADAAERVLTALRFFEHSPQGPEPDVTGYKGFYYHFLEMKDGRRAGGCELSTVDSAFLLAGMLVAGAFFDADAPVEREIRETADALYRRADWQWALYGVPCNANGWPTQTVEDVTIVHGGTPEKGFISYRYQGYDESLLMHVLALGSTTFALHAGVLPCVAEDVRLAKAIRTRISSLGATVHPPAQPLLARFTGNCRWVHPSQGARLFRE